MMNRILIFSITEIKLKKIGQKGWTTQEINELRRKYSKNWQTKAVSPKKFYLWQK